VFNSALFSGRVGGLSPWRLVRNGSFHPLPAMTDLFGKEIMLEDVPLGLFSFFGDGDSLRLMGDEDRAG